MGIWTSFCVDRIDSKRATFGCGIIANFIQDNRVSVSDTNLLSSRLDYCGMTHDIIEVDFSHFLIFILDVIRRDASGFFAMNSTKLWTNESDTFVLPQHCE